MIEKMKMVCVVSSVSRKDEMLDGLRSLGLLHLAEKKNPAPCSCRTLYNAFQDSCHSDGLCAG